MAGAKRLGGSVTVTRLPTDPADLFAVLYDDLAADSEQFDREADRWLDLPGFQETASQVEQMAHIEGEIDQAHLDSWMLPDSAAHRLAVLIGIDRALAHVNPQQDSVNAGALGPLLRRYAKKGRFSTDNVRGAVLPRLTWPARPAHQSTMAEAFTAVIRVSEASWQAISHDRIKGSQDLPRSNRQVSITVAPLLDSLQDLDITRIPGCSHDPRTGKMVDGYVLGPVDREEIRARIRGILSGFAKEKAVIGVLPEASLCDSLLAYWQELLKQLVQDPGTDPRHYWILVGTGPVGVPNSAGRHSNRAVILDQSGEQVFSQEKVRDFSLTPKTIRDWGLAEKLDDAALAVEWINRGSRIEVRESFSGRYAILICEDITGPTCRSVLEDCGVSHLLVPIFAAPLRGGWEFPRSEAQQYVRQIGSWVLVVNSLVTSVDDKKESFIGMLTGPSATSREEWGECHMEFIKHNGPHRIGVVTLPPDPGLPQVS
jgi:predicted amidohydrolase